MPGHLIGCPLGNLRYGVDCGVEYAQQVFMNAIRFAVNKKNGAYIEMGLGPATPSEATRFNLLDLVIITLFLGTVGSVVWLLLR